MNTDTRESMLSRSLQEVAEEYLVECGCCGSYHLDWFSGDCRDDSNRFGPPEDLANLWKAAPGLFVAAKAAIAALSQNKTYPADIKAAIRWLSDAIQETQCV